MRFDQGGSYVLFDMRFEIKLCDRPIVLTSAEGKNDAAVSSLTLSTLAPPDGDTETTQRCILYHRYAFILVIVKTMKIQRLVKHLAKPRKKYVYEKAPIKKSAVDAPVLLPMLLPRVLFCILPELPVFAISL